jgi:hypothetical protein
MSFTFYSNIFDRDFTAEDIDNLGLEPLYLLMDEIDACKKVNARQWRRVPKRFYTDEEDLGGLIQETKRIDTLYLTARRRAHLLNRATVTHLITGIKAWKKRAYILGKQLGMTQEQVKAITHETSEPT